MPRIEFTAEQMAALRKALGFRPGDRDVTPDDLIAVLAAQAITDAESRRWQGLGP